MGEYLYSDVKGPNLDHPDSIIRLSSVVHRFRIPKMVHKVSFPTSFHTVGSDPKTLSLMKTADSNRSLLYESTNSTKIASERIISDSKRYVPYINTILLSCKVQPEMARLDERLLFEWKSGLESKPVAIRSEAMMYDFVMTLVCLGLGYALSATENSIIGEFTNASRDYANAAGVLHYLAEQQLPKWITKGNSSEHDLPMECSPSVCTALSELFMANGQQMAIATLLMKEGKPNYSLLSKLCLGVYEQLDEYVSMMRRNAPTQKEKMETDFFSFVTFQCNLYRSLTCYFQARSLWDKMDYGNAIALLSESAIYLKTRDSLTSAVGIPDITKIPTLKVLESDLKDMKQHLSLLLRSWEKDNSSVYFMAVPQSVPSSIKLQEGIQMRKKTEYVLEDVEPVLLMLPDYDKKSKNDSSSKTSTQSSTTGTTSSKSHDPMPPPPSYEDLSPLAPPSMPPPPYQRSDSDLAREMQRKFDLES